MFNLFKKKKVKNLVIKCNTDSILIDEKPINFPTNHDNLTSILGVPSREINKASQYLFWDDYGIFCGYSDKNEILSINVYQNKKDTSEYNTKNQFKGKLLLNNEEITYNEFGKISLGKIAIHGLGRESESRFGFSLGINKIY